MSGPVGIALIGMGWWGQKILTVLQAAPADIRVLRAVDRTSKRSHDADSYSITGTQLVDNIASLEAVFAPVSTGKIQAAA
jgi:predicted dinucleotide-utilizing enzyme